jgi:hypothetical protein
VLSADGSQQQLVVADAYHVAQAAPATSYGADNLQQQQQQLPSALPVRGSPYVLMPATAADTTSSMSCTDRTLSSSSSTASSYVLCSAPADQRALLPGPSPAASCNSSSGRYATSTLMAQQQLVQPRLAQPQLMMAGAPGQHLQLPAQVELSSNVPQRSVSAAPSADSHLLSGPCGLQQLPAPLPEDASMLGATATCSPNYSMPQGWQAAGKQPLVGGGAMTAVTAAAVSGVCMPHTVLAGLFAAEATGGSGPLCGTDSIAQLPAAAMAPACLAGNAGQGYGRWFHDCSSYKYINMASTVRVQASGIAVRDGTLPLVYNSVRAAAPAGAAAAGPMVASPPLEPVQQRHSWLGAAGHGQLQLAAWVLRWLLLGVVPSFACSVACANICCGMMMRAAGSL